jgi:hypothetical protein
MASYTMTVTFELKDGRELECVYPVHVTPGNYSGLPENCYPDECDVGEAEYFLDGDEISVARLPKGLDVIAEAMYEADDSDKRFKFKQTEPDYDGPDYDPREWDDY